jgi:hypothetical protein
MLGVTVFWIGICFWTQPNSFDDSVFSNAYAEFVLNGDNYDDDDESD